jgi:hypothetical protein
MYRPDNTMASMAGHGTDPPICLVLSSQLDPALRGLLPKYATRAAYDGYQIPLARYGSVWARMIIEGLDALRDRPQVLAVDYRDLVADPGTTIGTVLDFLGLDRGTRWERRMAARIGPPRDTRRVVDDQQWHELTRACRSGMNRLYGRGGWNGKSPANKVTS